jgi:hypothetical protein
LAAGEVERHGGEGKIRNSKSERSEATQTGHFQFQKSGQIRKG